MTTQVPAWAVGVGQVAPEKLNQGQKVHQPWRFYVKAGASKRILFLTDVRQALAVREHNLQLMKRGKLTWGNVETCVSSIPGTRCPICTYADQYGKFASSVSYIFTILDLTPWVDKKTGAQHKYSKMLFAAKSTVMETLTRRSLERTDAGSLSGIAGCVYTASRPSDPKSAATGTDFSFVQAADLTKLPLEDQKPFDLISLLAPDVKRLGEIALSLRDGTAFGGSGRGGQAPAQDDFLGGSIVGGLEGEDLGAASFEVDYSNVDVDL